VKLERGDKDMCKNLFRRKYLKDKVFLCVKPSGGSQFWRGLHEIKGTCQKGLKYIVGEGVEIHSRRW
jgi:hypothetical protein